MKKRILLIIPNLGRGGAQQVFRQQLKYLSVEFDIFGCVFNWDGSFPEDQTENMFSLDVSAGRTFAGKAYYFILRIIRLRMLKREKKIQLSISHLEGADYVNILSRHRDRVIYWIHGTKRYDENIQGVMGALRMKILIPLLYNAADKLVTVSKGIADELEFFPVRSTSRIKTIHNGFDIENIMDLSQEPLPLEFCLLFRESKVIITHCRLSRQKNLEALFLIFKELENRYGVKLLIVGDGELREELLILCDNFGLQSWTSWSHKEMDLSFDVYFIGQQRNPFMFLRQSALYIMTSGWEGFPLALCEAILCGLPVMASDCFTGPREIIAPELTLRQPIQRPYANETGILMPLADRNNMHMIKLWVEELEKQLFGISNGEGKNISGIQRIKKLSISESMLQTISLINEILR